MEGKMTLYVIVLLFIKVNIECSPVRIFFLGHPRIDCNLLHKKVPKINPKKSYFNVQQKIARRTTGAKGAKKSKIKKSKSN